MRQSNTRTIAEQKPLGVIDALSAGLDLVRRRPWTLLIPILIDMLIWVAPRLSLTQLFRPVTLEVLGAAALSTDPQAAEDMRRAFQQPVESLNLAGLAAIALNTVTRLPSLLASDVTDVPSPVTAWAYAVPLQSPTLLLVLFIPLFLLGLAFVSVYLEWIAQGVRPLEAGRRGDGLLRAARLWLRLILFALLLIGLVVAAALALVLLQSVIASVEVRALVTLLLLVGLFWVFIYFFFVPAALAVSDVSLRQALRRSSLLFRAFFLPTVALVVLSVFLDRGLVIIWDGLAVSTLGVFIAIVANAYIGTSLLAAAMVYYQDRINFWERLRARAQIAKK